MTTLIQFFARHSGAYAIAFLASLCVSSAAQAEDITIEARLIWGTNDEKSTHPKHKPVDDATAKKLGKVFKWKNYFEETKRVETIPSRESRRLEMSSQCEIEVKELPSEPIEVKLIGKGKLINTTRKPLRKGELFIIGGDDKNQCAWFVVIEKK